jgi:hypothetical protein
MVRPQRTCNKPQFPFLLPGGVPWSLLPMRNTALLNRSAEHDSPFPRHPRLAARYPGWLGGVLLISGVIISQWNSERRPAAALAPE